MIDGWKYYNHSLITTIAPHLEADISQIKDGTIWKTDVGSKAFFARWTTDFDDERFQDWWYIIYDKPIDFSLQKKSHRRKIKKGLSNFDCYEISPLEYAEDMARITIAAWEEYPAKYRPNTSLKELVEEYRSWTYLTIGCFNHEGVLCAFDALEDCKDYWILGQGKADPKYEHGTEINAAITYTELEILKEDIIRGKYLTNGQRNTLHETNFNEDLCHWYGFRKAYCRLHITFNPKYRLFVKLIFPFRRILNAFNNVSIINKINTVLFMEEICRKQNAVNEQ